MKKNCLLNTAIQQNAPGINEWKTKSINPHTPRQVCMLLLWLVLTVSCNGQITTPLPKDSVGEPKTIPAEVPQVYGPASDAFSEGQVSQYIRRMFQDKNGDLWFGTNGDGVCRYNGKSLTYFTPTEGFSGRAVRGIVEDGSANLWFATDAGVCRYNMSRANHPCLQNSCNHDFQLEQDQREHDRELAKSFTRYTTRDGLSDDQVWSILIDRTGILWFGTEGGVNRFDGKTFTSFPIPEPDLKDFPDAYPAPKLAPCIYQDKTGDIWFGTNGGGVYRYDGTSLTNISERDGLCNNVVQCILEDKSGNLWFGTRFGGLCRYDGKSFNRFTAQEGLNIDFMWTLLEDKTGTLWIGTAGGGAYRYDGKSFTNFSAKEGLSNRYVQSILEDKNGRLWFGASGGLFRFDGKSFINVRKIGPWQ